jgi:AcrR family transcriptional regulator
MRVGTVMSTKDKILAGALALFNEEGFAPASALDVATALAISPGHLYYHFKGKAEIAAALFAQHEAEMAMILAAMPQAVADAGQGGAHAVAQTYLHILLEEMEDHRFLYREFVGLMRAHPALADGLTRLAQHQRKALGEAFSRLVPSAHLAAAAEAIQLGLWALPGQLELLAGEADPRARAALGAARLMGLVDLIAGPAIAGRPGKKGKKAKT